jgi:2-polyprenyl-6-methoxyphenol hydroxylase-like FAD-dependent oxidoreductase
LVGDAGCHQDPYLAHGIAAAFRDAELLTDAIGAGPSSEWALDHALAVYERKRDAAAAASYALNGLLATLEPPHEAFRHLLADAQGDQAAADRALGILAGTVTVPDILATVAESIGQPETATPLASGSPA